MNVRKIYFDMDGVLADFDRGVSELCGLPQIRQDETTGKDLDDKMWRRIRDIPHFYDMLEIMPGAKELFDAVYNRYGERTEILTGIPKPKRGILTADEDKETWMKRMLSDRITVNIVFKEEKPQYCKGKDCFLIDDLDKNIAAWEQMGGTGILFQSAQETMNRLKEMGVL